MFGLPLSWVLIGLGIAGLAGYIGLLKIKANMAARRAVIAALERDNARVEQRTTQKAHDAEHAYQQAHDAALNSPPSEPDPKHQARLNKINHLFPALLLCLTLIGGCASNPDRVVPSNPAEQVVIPAADRLEPVRFVPIDGTEYICMDPANADALSRNVIRLQARIAGLEAALRKLGAEVH